MQRSRAVFSCTVLTAAVLAPSCGRLPPPPAAVSVTTQHNDNFRDGQNLNETILTPALVRSGRFGRLFARTLRGQPYAQPLYLPNLDFGDGNKHNVIFSATEANDVYAWDADRPQQLRPYWHWNYGAPTVVTVSDNLRPTVGITSTPVIDPGARLMYFVTRIQGGQTCPYVKHGISHQLHAIDLVSGRDQIPPTVICAIIPGRHDGRDFNIHFDSMWQHQRPALLLDHGKIYIAFGSFGDQGPYWGWVFAYDAKTLQAAATPFVATPGGPPGEGGRGSFWQAGNGLAADEDGNVYGMTGNGSVDEGPQSAGPNLSESFVKLRVSDGVLTIAGYFTDGRHLLLNNRDKDLGSSGPLLFNLGGKRFITGGGKEGRLYTLNRDNVGFLQGFSAAGMTTDPNFITEWGERHIHSSPVWWNGPAGPLIYLCPEEEELRAYHFNANTYYDSGHPIWSKMHCAIGMPGGMMAVSANGNRDGIVWVNHPYNDVGNDSGDGDFAALSAIDATTMETLWESTNNPNADELGTFAKFSTPIIADGKVMVNAFETFSDVGHPPAAGYVVVYGQKCVPDCRTGTCVNGKCVPCTPQEITRNCGNRCHLSDGCGGTCECSANRECSSDPIIIEQKTIGAEAPTSAARPIPPTGVCVCSAKTIANSCAGRCNVSNGCGGLCGCSDGQTCNPQTQTCCDPRAECRQAGGCRQVCGGSFTCPCAASATCDPNNVCCVPKCTGVVCGALDGCGDTCFGTCPNPKTICVDDGERRSCQVKTGPCQRNPKFCNAEPKELISRCTKDPEYCFVKMGGMHMYRNHDGKIIKPKMNMKMP